MESAPAIRTPGVRRLVAMQVYPPAETQFGGTSPVHELPAEHTGPVATAGDQAAPTAEPEFKGGVTAAMALK